MPINDSICIDSIDHDQVYEIKFHGKPVNKFPLKNSNIEKTKEKNKIKDIFFSEKGPTIKIANPKNIDKNKGINITAKGMKPYEFIKVTSYKSLPREIKMFMSADDFAQLKSGQQNMYNNYIDMAKTRKNFQEQVEGGKTTPARELFEGMEKTMDEQSYVPKTVTDKDIAEMELMVKNRFNKGRKDNAEGGLQTMLGE